MTYVPSAQQQAYFDFLREGSGSVILEAAAGAGKSTTLVQGLQHMQGTVFLGAYNKKAAEDLKSKVAAQGPHSSSVRVGTMHSAGFGTWRRFAPNTKVSPYKVNDLIKLRVNEGLIPEQIAPLVEKLVSLGKQMLAGVKWKTSNHGAWYRLVDHFGLEADLPEDVEVSTLIEHVEEVFNASGSMCLEHIDFDDMIWAPLAYKARFYQNDWVLADESQDFNPSRMEIAKRMLKPGGRLVAVGDSRQGIYGYQGAMSDAMDQIQSTWNCARLPLSVSYRCPQAVVRHAHRYVPPSHIQAHADAPMGSVRRVERASPLYPPPPWHVVDAPSPDDAVLCRYTAPLVKLAFSMIRHGQPCQVEGRDIGKGLIALVRRWKVRTLDQLEDKLEEWVTREVAKLRDGAPPDSIHDRRDTLHILIDRCRSKGTDDVASLVLEIESLFADEVKGVTTLCTGHKSKGREWPRVYWLESEEREWMNQQPWQAEQEMNVKYVITTRALKELILVSP